jgi:hypothetical protein
LPFWYQSTNLATRYFLHMAWLLVDSSWIDKYLSLLPNHISLAPLFTMATSSQTTFYLKSSSYGIWEQTSQVRLMNVSPKLDIHG